MQKVVLYCLALAGIFSLSCSDVGSNKIIPGYDLSAPDARFILPDILHEVSGLTETGGSTFACVQDENGVLFIFDVESNRIVKEIPFGYNGDYEGIARVENTIYVLRSDGVLYEVPEYEEGKLPTIFHNTEITAANNEGLCYDKKNNRLLIGVKGKISREREEKSRRLIYAFDLATKKLEPVPAYEFDAEAITTFAIKNKAIPATRENKKGRTVTSSVKFATSEIAIHPINNLLYVLSARDHLIMVFDEKGNIVQIAALDPLLFNKAEGITFFANGDMLITNEGQEKVPTLLRFRYRGSK
jgi:uncharacterized protein YjiK